MSRTMLTRYALAAAVLIALAAPPATADERPFPHIHIRGTLRAADGFPVSYGDVQWSGGDANKLRPANCTPPAGRTNMNLEGSGANYNVVVWLNDTPACVEGMQTFTPDLSAIPTPTRAGWSFRRQ